MYGDIHKYIRIDMFTLFAYTHVYVCVSIYISLSIYI